MNASYRTLEDALRLIGTVDAASGQICQMKDDKPDLLLFEFGCPSCSEVAGKNADEYGDALATIVNAAPGIIADLSRYQQIVQDVLQEMYEEMRAGAEFENPMLAAASRIALKWLEAKEVSTP
jgi:hypothetical protein